MSAFSPPRQAPNGLGRRSAHRLIQEPRQAQAGDPELAVENRQDVPEIPVVQDVVGGALIKDLFRKLSASLDGADMCSPTLETTGTRWRKPDNRIGSDSCAREPVRRLLPGSV